MNRAQPDGDPPGRKRAADFLEDQVRLLSHQLQHPRAGLAQPGAAVAAHRTRAGMAFGPPAPRPTDGAADADIKPPRRCPCAAAQRHETNHTLPQVLRVRGRHIASNGTVQPQPRQSAKTRKPLSLRVYLIGNCSSKPKPIQSQMVTSPNRSTPKVLLSYAGSELRQSR